MPEAPPSEPATAPGSTPTPGSVAAPEDLDAAGRARYLTDVMAEIDAEVRRRRASGDLPAGLERELDELFLEFSPVGMQGRARLRENLALVDGAAYVDIAVPVESQKAVGTYVKRLIRKALSWYIGFIIHQVVKFAWATARMLHLVVDHIEDLEAAVDVLRVPELPTTAVPVVDPGSSWWAGDALAALSGVSGRVVHAECGNGSLVAQLVAAGVDAYGVDPAETVIEPAIDAGLDVRAESALDHLGVVADEALAGMVLSGSVQWLHPNERDRLVALVVSRLAVDGVLVLHSATPEAWNRSTAHLVADLAPGRPLHADTWTHLLAAHGFRRTVLRTGGEDRRLDRVPVADDADAAAGRTAAVNTAAINAAIDALNDLLLGPGEYVLVAVRER